MLEGFANFLPETEQVLWLQRLQSTRAITGSSSQQSGNSSASLLDNHQTGINIDTEVTRLHESDNVIFSNSLRNHLRAGICASSEDRFQDCNAYCNRTSGHDIGPPLETIIEGQSSTPILDIELDFFTEEMTLSDFMRTSSGLLGTQSIGSSFSFNDHAEGLRSLSSSNMPRFEGALGGTRLNGRIGSASCSNLSGLGNESVEPISERSASPRELTGLSLEYILAQQNSQETFSGAGRPAAQQPSRCHPRAITSRCLLRRSGADPPRLPLMSVDRISGESPRMLRSSYASEPPAAVTR